MVDLVITNPVRRRIVGSIFGAQTLFSAAVILSFTLTPIIAAELVGNDAVAGLPSTVTLIARAAFAYPIGWLLDRWGRRMGLSLGYIVGIGGSVLAAWSIVIGSFAGFLAGAALLGISRASSEQSRYVASEVFPTGRRAKVIGWVVFAGTIGAIFGPLLVEPAGLLAENLGLPSASGPFLIAGAMLLFAAVVTFGLLRPDPQRIGRAIDLEERRQKKEDLDVEEMARPLRQIFASPLALTAVAAMTIGQIVMVMLMVITPLNMAHNEHGTQAISLVIMAHTLGMFGLSGLTGWLIDRLGRLALIAAGSSILIVACLLAPLSSGMLMLALSLFLLGLGWNFAFVAGSTLLSDQLAPVERGRAQGAGEMSVAIGAGLGSLTSGFIFARGDMWAVSIVGLAFSLALLGMVIWLKLSRSGSQEYAAGHD